MYFYFNSLIILQYQILTTKTMILNIKNLVKSTLSNQSILPDFYS